MTTDHAEKLAEALEPFVKLANEWEAYIRKTEPEYTDELVDESYVDEAEFVHFRRAREALAAYRASEPAAQDGWTTFCVQIDGGEVHTIRTRSGIYRDAAAASLAILDHSAPAEIKIWAPDVVKEYGPYYYIARENEFGNLLIENAIPSPHPPAAVSE